LRALARASLILAALAACNAILGNEKRTLDDRPEGGTRNDGGDDSSTGDDGGPDATCNADLQTDKANCGRCSHDCLGGECKAGVCQPFTIASGLNTPDYPVVVDHIAYWTSNDGSVLSCPVVACTKPKQLMQIDAGNPLPNGLDVHKGNVYVVGYYSQAAQSIPIGGGAPTTVIAGLDYPSRVLADDSNVYYLNANTADLERCDLPKCTRRVRIAVGQPAWFKMARSDDANIYWLESPNATPTNGTIYKAPRNRELDGGGDTILSNRHPTEMVIRKGVLYMTEDTNVIAITLVAGLPSFPLAQTESSPRGIDVDDTTAYWVTEGDGAVKSCPFAGCNFKPAIIASGQNQPRGPYVTDDAIYWTEFNGGTIRGVAK
jgi:hypothetical protein